MIEHHNPNRNGDVAYRKEDRGDIWKIWGIAFSCISYSIPFTFVFLIFWKWDVGISMKGAHAFMWLQTAETRINGRL